MTSFWKEKKVFVTGGAGFIGSHLSKKLLTSGAHVTLSLSKQTSPEKVRKNIGELTGECIFKTVDLLSQVESDEAMRGQDVVFHMAALDGGTAYKLSYPADIFQQNVQMTLNVLESARKHALKKVFLMSSIELYPSTAVSPFDEKTMPFEMLTDKRSGYAWSKRFLEVAAFFYANQHKLEIAIARAGNVYGPNDQLYTGRVIPTFIQRIAGGEEVVLWGDGQQKRSFLYVSDFVDASLKLTQKHAECDPVNIASEHVISMKALAEMIGRIMKKDVHFKYITPPSQIFNDRVANVTKAKREIEFEEEMSLEDGLTKTVEAFLEK